MLEGRLSLLAVEAIGMGRFNNFLAELWPTGNWTETGRSESELWFVIFD